MGSMALKVTRDRKDHLVRRVSKVRRVFRANPVLDLTAPKATRVRRGHRDQLARAVRRGRRACRGLTVPMAMRGNRECRARRAR